MGKRPASPSPSVNGHAEVIALADAPAHTAPDPISQVEGHGTASRTGRGLKAKLNRDAEAAEARAMPERREPGTGQLRIIKVRLTHIDALRGLQGQALLSWNHDPAALHGGE